MGLWEICIAVLFLNDGDLWLFHVGKSVNST